MYVPSDIGVRAVTPAPTGPKRAYLRLFGVPDVRVHLTATHLMRAMPQASARRTVLDVGCGNGWITSMMASHDPLGEYVGWDRDASSVAYASRHTAAHGVPNVRFETVDLERDRLTGEYDCITCLAVLQFIHDIPALLARLTALLKPGGHIVLQLPVSRLRKALLRVPSLAARLPEFHEARQGFTEAECRDLIRESCLAMVDIRWAIKGPSIIAKELFYLAASIGDGFAACLTPALNWTTVFDPWYPGRGNGLFVIARKSNCPPGQPHP